MHKKLYPAFLILLFFTIQHSVKAADNQATAQQVNVEKMELTLVVEQYSQLIPKDILNEWLSYSTSYSLSSNTKGEFENNSLCPVNKIFCEFTLTNVQKRHLLLSSQPKIESMLRTSSREAIGMILLKLKC